VHPDCRLFGENVAFARACTDAGLSFIGPVAEGDHDDRQQTGAPDVTIRGVPVVPGTKRRSGSGGGSDKRHDPGDPLS